MRASLVMADPFRKFLLLNLVSGGAVLVGVLSFSLFREQRYRGHYLSLANKTDYCRVMHNQAAKKLDDMLRAESESIKNLRAVLLQPLRGRVLEVAVGSAPNLSHYSAEVELVGLDWSPRMLDLARAKTKGRMKLIEGDLCRLPFEDSSFDAVVCTFGLCSTLQPQQALAEMRRVVKSESCASATTRICALVDATTIKTWINWCLFQVCILYSAGEKTKEEYMHTH